MKRVKIISLILAICLLFGTAPSVFSTDGVYADVFDSADSLDVIKVFTSNLRLGDLDADGSVGLKDSKSIKKITAGDLFRVCRFTIDVNSDGIINLKDTLKLKKIIAAVDPLEYVCNTIVSKSFDAEESAVKLAEEEAGTTGAFFEIDLEDNGPGYFAVVLKGTDDCAISTANYNNNKSNAACEKIVGNNYSAWVATLPSYSGLHTLEVLFDDAPETGREVFVDSVVFADTYEGARAFAEERVNARHIDDAEEFKYITINFDSQTELSRIISRNNTSASYSSDYNAMKLQVSGSSSDPWALVSFEDLGIDADEYKYIVYKSMCPSTCHQALPEAELFYVVGDIAQPRAGYSTIYSQIKDSEFHSSIFELTNAAFWTGTVHALRFDYYCGCAVGDTQYVRSVTFCNTYEAAAAIATDRNAKTTDYRQLFYYGKYDDGEFKLSYRMYVPFDYDGEREYPFLMMLHGAGERGDNGTYHLTGGFPYLFSNTDKSTFNVICFAPQCPENMKWVDCDWGYGSYSVVNIPESKPLGAAISVVNKAFQNYKIDRDRVYVTGLSMGGYGTWDTLLRHNDIFAAGVPLCGGGNPSQASRLLDVPIRAYHGTADNIVPSRGSKQMYDAIVALGGTKCSYTALGGYDHFIWDYVYQQQWVFDWLYQQRISDR